MREWGRGADECSALQLSMWSARQSAEVVDKPDARRAARRKCHHSLLCRSQQQAQAPSFHEETSSRDWIACWSLNGAEHDGAMKLDALGRKGCRGWLIGSGLRSIRERRREESHEKGSKDRDHDATSDRCVELPIVTAHVDVRGHTADK
mmetsp:Transcript_63554/g.170065  ORF Transcript_63554/g.170065 Transcript_63554/m.170065 type:complete len:149 (+) Transcript_63554:132-578(+)